jgi:hypothetical protein
VVTAAVRPTVLAPMIAATSVTTRPILLLSNVRAHDDARETRNIPNLLFAVRPLRERPRQRWSIACGSAVSVDL